MRDRVILDTGPLVAFLNRQDRFHDWAVAQLTGVTPPLLTCESVLSEACFLVRKLPGGREAVLELVRRGLIAARFDLTREVARVARLVRGYANIPMSLADACLVRMAELEPEGVVLTLDSGFRIYRKNGRHIVPTRMPG